MTAIRTIAISLAALFGLVTMTHVAMADVFNLPPGQTSMSLVWVRNAGNSGQTCGGYGSPATICGDVAYDYKMGKFEVTAAQFTQFLNAVAADDTYALYSTVMANPDGEFGSGITRSGSAGTYTYSIMPGWDNRPITDVNWGDAIRFVNWLENGQPTGPEGLSTTEDGSYFLNGAVSQPDLMTITRKPGAHFVLPTEDEWYKAAFHKNDGPTDHFWFYATRSNAPPSNGIHDPDPGSNANYYNGVRFALGPPYYKTVVGEFENSTSPYGTFDQNGNVEEWNETAVTATQRGTMGGDWSSFSTRMSSDGRAFDNPLFGGGIRGFRIAYVPEPATAGLLLAALALRSRRFHR